MSNRQSELIGYFERELRCLRSYAAEFAKLYPNEARGLLLNEDRSADPHVERMMEAFALLTARVQLKLDDEFPELTDALLGILYPHYLSPIPSMSVVQLHLQPGMVDLPAGLLVPRETYLRTAPVDGVRCRYRTGYDTTLWPVRLAEARVLTPPFPRGTDAPEGATAALRLRIESLGDAPLASMALERLRVYLRGDGPVVAGLYDLLTNGVKRAAFSTPDLGASSTDTPADWITPVGFGPREELLPYPPQAFPGYRLLTEFFAFPQKFHFLDLGGWADENNRPWLMGRAVELLFFFHRPLPEGFESAISADNFRLGCTPMVNLFPKAVEGIKLREKRYDHPIAPDVDAPFGYEVYSVDAVEHIEPGVPRPTAYERFYSFRHGRQREGEAYWYSTRQRWERETPNRDIDRGTEVVLNLVDLHFRPAHVADKTLVVRTTCMNRDLPARSLKDAGESLVFEPETTLPLHRVECLRPVTPTLRPPLRREAHWRLVSHLSLNHLSLAHGEQGRDALQEYLRLYDFSDPDSQPQLAAVARSIVEGVTELRCKRVIEFVGADESATGYARGMEIGLTLDEAKYAGVGAVLFASVLERFLALYASINSFTVLELRTRQSEGVVKRWKPRAGERELL